MDYALNCELNVLELLLSECLLTATKKKPRGTPFLRFEVQDLHGATWTQLLHQSLGNISSNSSDRPQVWKKYGVSQVKRDRLKGKEPWKRILVISSVNLT